ncbi:sensor histidine kinase [Nonomuraea recticatena]|uniref:histidine kinase n=1 Tax=Nonomuraea recticatena TaxID=46178 RepID=A0ABP6EQY2_9ACTN
MRGQGASFRRLHARLFRSVRGRATLVALGVAATVLLVCAILVRTLLQLSTEDVASARAAHAALHVAFQITVTPVNDPIPVLPGESDMLQVVADDGRVLGATPPLRGLPPISRARPLEADSRVDTTECPSSLPTCVRVVGIAVGQTAYGTPVLVYGAVPFPSGVSGWQGNVLLAVMAIVLLTLIGLATWTTIGTALRPVEAITREMAEISGTAALHRRVPVPETSGEIQRLAETVNHTLGHLQQATEQQRRFVSDASHDLRNPITGLLTRLEVALDDPQDSDWKSTVRAALRDTQRLSDIVADLLELARLDAGAFQPAERLDLAELVVSEVELHRRRVPIVTRLAAGTVVEANRLRLARVLGNLLANAERHAHSVIEVSVWTDHSQGQAVLEVHDDGEGIPFEARERVFDRFARLDSARRLDTGGTGLGLPIAREIARSYGGSLVVADSERGARLVLRLPALS